jgi:hypothetical protein
VGLIKETPHLSDDRDVVSPSVQDAAFLCGPKDVRVNKDLYGL